MPISLRATHVGPTSELNLQWCNLEKYVKGKGPISIGFLYLRKGIPLIILGFNWYALKILQNIIQ